jgi:hypothetical protein
LFFNAITFLPCIGFCFCFSFGASIDNSLFCELP